MLTYRPNQHGWNNMALKIEYETNFGITCEYAHCVIVDTRCSKETDMEGNKTYPVQYNGKIYASDDAYADNASPVGGFNGDFLMTEAGAKTQYNIIKQCYLDLKTQDGFTDGEDC